MGNQTEKTGGAEIAATTTAPKRRTTLKPKSAPRAAKTARTAPRAKKKAAAPIALSQEEIALRAYFIAERRQQSGEPGDSFGDWIEAERQLLAERAVPSAK